jgi:hypothetical protein
MSDSLDALAARAAGGPRFLGFALSAYQQRHALTDAALARELGCNDAPAASPSTPRRCAGSSKRQATRRPTRRDRRPADLARSNRALIYGRARCPLWNGQPVRPAHPEADGETTRGRIYRRLLRSMGPTHRTPRHKLNAVSRTDARNGGGAGKGACR